MNALRLKAESRAYFRALSKHITELRKEILMSKPSWRVRSGCHSRQCSRTRWATVACRC
jgi:hypothetical protein